MLFKILFALGCLSALFFGTLTNLHAAEQATYVGTDACKDCHQDQYDKFKKYSKKAKSSHSVSIMAKKLTTEELKECYSCHATGYGKPGGFISPEKTPHLADAGCEVCHGPGSNHVMTQDPKSITRKMSINDCTVCHNSDRVKAFGFKPIKFAGAH